MQWVDTFSKHAFHFWNYRHISCPLGPLLSLGLLSAGNKVWKRMSSLLALWLMMGSSILKVTQGHSWEAAWKWDSAVTRAMSRDGGFGWPLCLPGKQPREHVLPRYLVRTFKGALLYMALAHPCWANDLEIVWSGSQKWLQFQNPGDRQEGGEFKPILGYMARSYLNKHTHFAQESAQNLKLWALPTSCGWWAAWSASFQCP